RHRQFLLRPGGFRRRPALCRGRDGLVGPAVRLAVTARRHQSGSSRRVEHEGHPHHPATGAETVSERTINTAYVTIHGDESTGIRDGVVTVSDLEYDLSI